MRGRHNHIPSGPSPTEKAKIIKGLMHACGQPGWSQAKLYIALKDHFEGTTDFDRQSIIMPSKATMTRAIKDKVIYSDHLAVVAASWLASHIADSAFVGSSEAEVFAASCRKVLGRPPDSGADKLAKYQGHYELVRPYHMDPNHSLLRDVLSIGAGDDLFTCQFGSEHRDDRGNAHCLSLQGQCVPHGRKLMILFGSGGGDYTNVLLYFDVVVLMAHVSGSGSVVDWMSGIMIASVDSGRDEASAYPVYVRRTEAAPTSQIFPKGKPATTLLKSLPAEGRRVLRKGCVHWNDAEFPSPFEMGVRVNSAVKRLPGISRFAASREAKRK